MKILCTGCLTLLALIFCRAFGWITPVSDEWFVVGLFILSGATYLAALMWLEYEADE